MFPRSTRLPAASVLRAVPRRILKGFKGLGLVVGAPSVGVLAMRAVNERRKHIAIMRALGYRAAMIRAGFIIESVFVAVVAITIIAALITTYIPARQASRIYPAKTQPSRSPLRRRGALGRPVLPRSTRLPATSVLRAVPRRILERVAELAHRSAHLAHSARLGTGRRINHPGATIEP